MVGLPDTAVKEAKERVGSAIKNSGFPFPNGRITVNLAPADIRKEGPAYDLPIAVGIMVASGQALADVTDSVFLGELSLDGAVRHAHGILPMVALARERGIRTVFVPAVDAAEAALVPDMTVYPGRHAGALLNHLCGDAAHRAARLDGRAAAASPRRVGRHRLPRHQGPGARQARAGGGGRWRPQRADVGPPGSGKTLLARAMPSILPRMTPTRRWR